jgi:hypothetical protein
LVSFSPRNLAPRPALGSLEAVGDFCERIGYVSENVESNETMEAALDRAGDMEISLSLQETMRGAIKRKILYLISVCRTWHTPCNGYVTTHEESLGIPKTVFRIHNHTAVEVGTRMLRSRTYLFSWYYRKVELGVIQYTAHTAATRGLLPRFPSTLACRIGNVFLGKVGLDIVPVGLKALKSSAVAASYLDIYPVTVFRIAGPCAGPCSLHCY